MNNNFIYKYNPKRTLFIVIPLVSILITLAYLTSGAANLEKTAKWFPFLNGIISTGGIWLGCYMIVTFLWKKFPWERSPVKHLVIEILAITLYVCLFGLLLIGLRKAFPEYYKTANIQIPKIFDFLITLLITYFITCIHEAIFFYRQWKFHFSKSARLEKDNMEARYETLKSQINPHFLFNSLNSLSMLVDDNKNATNYIQNLSEFLRYGLKSNNRELVLVKDEVKVVEKYILLQKTRFAENIEININIDERFYHYSLPPMTLQILVENCIKHNIISKNKPLKIDISAHNNAITVKNNLQLKSNVESTGHGIKNIKARLAFFTNSELKITETKSEFKVVVPLLTIEL